MPVTYSTLQEEVKRRATRNQGGSQFDTAIKNVINFSLFRIARELPWRSLRRKADFNTVTSYTTGTGTAAATSGSTIVTASSANFITDGVEINRKVKFSGSGKYYFISQITGNSSMVLDQTWAASTTTAMTMEVLPQETYNLPIQAGHRLFMWHEGFGYPFRMSYITDQDFYQHGVYLTIKYLPTCYRMWGEDMVQTQLRQPSIVSAACGATNSASVSVTIFGNVAGYPDYETLTLAAALTSTTNGTKVFQSVERVVKNATTTGTITVSANSGNDTVAVLPVGDTTSGIRYRKISLYPLPNQVFPIHCQYYKDPYRLVNDGDVHEMGEEFDEAIILLASAKLKAEQNLNTEADRMFSMYMEELQALKRTNIDKIDWFPTLRRPRSSGGDALVTNNLYFKQAGANFGPASRF